MDAKGDKYLVIIFSLSLIERQVILSRASINDQNKFLSLIKTINKLITIFSQLAINKMPFNKRNDYRSY